MPIAIWQKQSEGYPCTWWPVSQKESGASRYQLSPGFLCYSPPPSLGPGSLGLESCWVKQGTIQLCSAEGRGWGVYVGAPLLTPDFTKILFLVIPLLQRHHILHLPEVLGFKSGSFLAFLSTSLELAFPDCLKSLLRVHLFSGTKTRLLLSLFLWLSLLSLLFNPWGFMHWLSYGFCGISKGNELKGMCLSSHLQAGISYKDFL